MTIIPRSPDAARLAAGLSVLQLAEALGMGQRQLRRYLYPRGHHDAQVPRADLLLSMSEALGLGALGVAELAAWYAEER